jgi:hypothetical protein
MGAAGLQAMEGDSGKPWSVSARLRGFYDSNYNTAPSDPKASAVLGYQKEAESWGVQVTPGISYSLLRDVNRLTLSYSYDMKWYEARDDNEIDDSHNAEIAYSHAFSERLQLEVFDTFVYASEPDVIEPAQKATYQRTDGSAYRNYAGAALNAGLTEKLGTRLAYSNSNYDYTDDGPGSRSALLDRMEHLATVDLRWKFQPALVGMAGYQYGYTAYASTDFVYDNVKYGGWPAGKPIPTGEQRDQQSHYGFVGADYTANPSLTVQGRVGFVYTEYPDLDADSLLAPYVDAAVVWEYLRGSKFSFGVKSDVRPTDVAMADANGSITTSQEATTLYAMISHKITEKLQGNLRGSWQFGTFNGGFSDGETDNFWTLDASLAYSINKYLMVEMGYAYDKLDSDVTSAGIDVRSYDRNRFFFGLRGTY